MFNKVRLLRDLKNDQWVRPFLHYYKKTLWLALTLGVLTFVCGAGLMFDSGYLISKAATHPDNILLIYVPIVLTRAFGIGRPALRYVERLVSHNWVLKMTSAFRKKLYDSLEGDAVFFDSKDQLGDILGLLSEDISHIQNLYLRTAFPMIVSWSLYVIIVVGIGFLSPLMGLWVLITFGLMIFAIPLWSVIINGARQAVEKKTKNDLYTDLTDNVMGITDWVLAERGQEYVNLHNQHEEQLMKVQHRMHRFEFFRNFVLQMLFILIVVSLLLWAGAYFGGQYGGPANWIAAFVLAAFPLVDAFAGLPDAAQETNIYADSLERLNDLPKPQAAQEAGPSLNGPFTVKVEDVHYTYPQTTREVLSGVDLTITPGQKLAILGRSGSGKSTLAALLRGDRTPTKGQITLNGVATGTLGDQVADYVGVINQSPHLFNTTVANNVRIGNENASDEQVWDVLERVGLAEMIKKLPQGLETQV
ncbi:MAG: thiol reductant ABC exporter subunit CydC, partial [Limosilactobacillus fermentum]|nr:thiol reductant ABC exporter subunit CydC [Limosilactobacillus fermentum]